MVKQNVGTFLKEFRKEKGLRLKDVAGQLESTTSYLSQIENGIRQPSDKALTTVLIKGFDLRNSEAEGLIKKWRVQMYDPDINISTQYIYDKTKGVNLIPYYDEIDQTLEKSQPLNHWPFPFKDADKAKNFFVYQMKDDSMEPAIPQGAYLIIDRDPGALDSQSIILANTDSKTVCRLYKPVEDNVKLIPANNSHSVFFGKNFITLGRIEAVILEVSAEKFIQ